MLMGILQYLSSVLFLFLHVQNSGSFPKALSAAEERRCLEQMEKGDAGARQKLIEHNLRLVVHIAKKYKSSTSFNRDFTGLNPVTAIPSSPLQFLSYFAFRLRRANRAFHRKAVVPPIPSRAISPGSETR